MPHQSLPPLALHASVVSLWAIPALVGTLAPDALAGPMAGATFLTLGVLLTTLVHRTYGAPSDA
jgi:hypothetical protein